MRFTVLGVQGLQNALMKATVVGRTAMTLAGGRLMEEVFNESQVLVPRDTGALAASGRVVGPNVSAGGVEWYITYGNDDQVDYAIYVHEILDNWHPAPTQAKFLEQPMLEKANALESEMANMMESHFRSIGRY